jgi:hypothetical protein
MPEVSSCPYCGKIDAPCSKVTSLKGAWARNSCKKKYRGKPVGKVTTQPCSEDHYLLQ